MVSEDLLVLVDAVDDSVVTTADDYEWNAPRCDKKGKYENSIGKVAIQVVEATAGEKSFRYISVYSKQRHKAKNCRIYPGGKDYNKCPESGHFAAWIQWSRDADVSLDCHHGNRHDR
ncbi:hypothetical protein CDAR_44101 [Caerostris darwini]|uniref:Uncharacterized protein n=1 Tax=Caerostris darwini TaxID=1538125 RepID=A0AAV4UMF6_9ARAC|nr:hypothetical protein CDAR_44101 [Caerostris darwini]